MLPTNVVRRALILALAVGLLSPGTFARVAAAAPDSPEETKEQRDQRMAWWREARFGMFIHWGLYAIPAGIWQNGDQKVFSAEWIMHKAKIPVKDYEKLAAKFNPVKFDADQWVQLAKNAGMKYIVITTKHHDGFAMFPSKASPFNINDATPFRRDPLKELAEACRKHDIKLGFYYSQAQDWHHPGGAASGGQHWDSAQDGDMTEYVRNVAVPQVREILSNYGPVAVLWWDSATNMNKERADLLQPLLKLQPGIIANDRLDGRVPGDIITPENVIPPRGYPGRDWETCMTLNGNWGYVSFDNRWKSTETLIRNLVDIASKGGNLLLNVGPTAEGVIPEPSVERLQAVGHWLQVNGPSIYGTTGSAFNRLAWGRCTQKPGVLYLHVFDWPKAELIVPGLRNKVTKAYLLADPDRSALSVTAKDGDVAVKLPAEAPDPVDSVVVLEIDGKPEVTQLPPGQEKDGSLLLTAFDATIHGKTSQLQIVSRRGRIRLSPSRSDWLSWEFDIDRPGKFDVGIVYTGDRGKSGCEYVVSVGDQSLSGTVEEPSQRRAGRPRPNRLGQFTFAKPGRYTLSLRSNGGPDEAILNLDSITMRPVGTPVPPTDEGE